MLIFSYSLAQRIRVFLGNIMKKLLAFLLIANLAHASNFAETDNQSGGKIVITTDACQKDVSMSRAYNYTQDGKTEDGCWKYDSDTVVVFWDVIGKRRYPISYFKLVNEFNKFRSF